MKREVKKSMEFYEDKWKRVNNWSNERNPYFKKTVDVEAVKGLEVLQESLTKGSKVLTLGCGGGRNTIFFEEGGFETHGLDLSLTAVELAQELKREKDSNAGFTQGSVLNLPYKENCFHAVTDYGCFHHVRRKHWTDYIENVNRVLKPRGFFLLYTFSSESGKTGNYDPSTRKNWSLRRGHYNHYFRKEELRNVFKSSFEIIKIITIREDGRVLVFYVTLMQKL